MLGLAVDPSKLPVELENHLDALHASMGTAVEIALDAAWLIPGDYAYPNYFATIASPSLGMFMPPRFDGEESPAGSTSLPVPTGETIVFHLTSEHLRLLRALRIDWREPHSLVGINFKRPYGDMTYFEIDMADILGIPIPRDEQHQPHFSTEQRQHFHRLHTDMLSALPVFLRHGILSSGEYQVVDEVWQLAEVSAP